MSEEENSMVAAATREEDPADVENQQAEQEQEEQQAAAAGRRSPTRTRTRTPSQTLIEFAPTSGRHLTESHALFNSPHHLPGHEGEMMGPILRRKKVVSMPLGAGGDFFVSNDRGGPHHQLMDEDLRHPQRLRQKSVGAPPLPPISSPPLTRQTTPRRRHSKQDSGASAFMKGVVRRKQVSLDLLGPNDFFAPPAEEEEEEEEITPLPTTPEDEALVAPPPGKKLFRPLRFAPRRVVSRKGGRSGGQGGSAHGGRGASGHGADGHERSINSVPDKVDEEAAQAFGRYSRTSQEIKLQILSLQKQLQESNASPELLKASEQMLKTHSELKPDEQLLKSKFTTQPALITEETMVNDEDEDGEDLEDKESDDGLGDVDDSDIIKATKADKIKTAFVFLIMLGVTLGVTLWDTHLEDDVYIFEPIGTACATDCRGDLDTLDFFNGHNQFHSGDVIQLLMNLDPNPLAEEDDRALIYIVGNETNMVKKTVKFGPPDHHERLTHHEKVKVDWEDPHEHHIIVVNSTNPEVVMTFTLSAHVLTPLASHSELVGALILVFVYAFILIEVIHRTLVAIFGSMVALMFYFIMNDGRVFSIRIIMLNIEWSTIGLLFGMMLIVGELSHTGVFEFVAVRLLVISKGSFKRLLVLLCTLTALASAMLDNVTTMLLVAPVTIDMCNILDVDPRPYLIGEVLLSNIGGTATLIGDPPNIIIGSSYEEIGFVDFLSNVLPAIFLFCIPASLILILWIYRYYFTSTKMRVLDVDKLKKTYPIYDEPRLMIAGMTTFFVILMFFLHPIHHKDTAWIALIGAFLTIAFTNPHDVQDALRNHVEWDSLLFFAGLFVLIEVVAAMGLLDAIGNWLAGIIERQPPGNQLVVAITLIMWVSGFVSSILDNIPYTVTLVPIIRLLADALPETLPLTTLVWALSFGACLGGNGTLLGASANIVTAGLSSNKGFEISFLNFLYPGMLTMIVTIAICNLYMLVRYVWA